MKRKICLIVALCSLFAFCLVAGNVGFLTAYSVKAERISSAQNDEKEEAATAHSHCVCGKNEDVGDHISHSDVVYLSWAGNDFDYDGGDTGAAYLFLEEDVVTGAKSCNRTDGDGILSIKTGQTLYLCLNGHSLANGLTGNNAIDVVGTLVLCDCVGNGSIGGRTSGANSGAIWVSDGKFDMYGGSLTGSSGVKNGAGIYVKGNSVARMYGGAITENSALRQAGGAYILDTSTFIMYGGEISRNGAPDFGGGVIVDNGSSFVMNGGKIADNFTARNGGGVFVSGGSFTMNGGTVENNKASNGGGICATYDYGKGQITLNGGEISGNTAFGNGGGVYIWEKSSLSIKGGTIKTNSAAYGGGVCMYSANRKNVQTDNNDLFFSSGTIEGNTASVSGGGVCCFQYSMLNFDGSGAIKIADNETSNLYFADLIKDKDTKLTVTNLVEGSSIGVSAMQKPEKGSPVVISFVQADFGEYFFSDSSDYVIKYEGNAVKLTADFYRATLKYVTYGEQAIPDESATGFSEEVKIVVTNERPTLVCNSFVGWTDEIGSDTAKYFGGEEIGVTGEKTLYAVWAGFSHDFTTSEEVKATCEQNGVKAYCKCKNCGKTFLIGEDGAQKEISSENELVIPAAGHNFGEWQEEIPATTEKEGTLAHKDCKNCGKHFDAEGREITDISVEKLPDKKQDDKGCGGSVCADGALLCFVAATAAVVFVLKRKSEKRI